MPDPAAVVETFPIVPRQSGAGLAVVLLVAAPLAIGVVTAARSDATFRSHERG